MAQGGAVRTDRPVALLVSGLSLGILAQYLFVGEAPGIGFVVGIAAVLALDAAVRGSRPSIGAPTLFFTGALIFAGLVAVRTDSALVAFDVAAALGLAFSGLLASRGIDVYRAHVGAIPAVVSLGLGALTTRLPSVYRVALPAISGQARARSSRAIPYASGIALAAPLLVVFVVLFSAADAVFQRSVRDMLDIAWLREILPTLPQRLVVAFAVTWCATGALAMGTAAPALSTAERRVRRLLGGEPVTVALVAVDLLFAAFVAFQLTYLFGGRDTLEASGIAYSAYARRGFFELLGVATLVGAMLFTFDLLVRSRSRVYVGAAIVLVLLTGVVLASAATRMTLYQQAYGWTELRLYAYAGIAFVAIVLALLAAAVMTHRMERVVGSLIGAMLAVALGVNAIGPSGQVAAANIERSLDTAPLAENAVRELDLSYLVALGDGAIPAIVERLPALPERERERIRGVLRTVSQTRRVPAGWSSWSWDRSRASELLAQQ
ncbi:MAG: hypothetical protein QOF63_4019 [Thermoanaerobaculia bacterium]|nr:hypothetical protein [Thermoanaerobaculia bacterium]